MQLTITEKKESPLLGRTTILAAVEFSGASPSNADVTAELAKQTNAKPDLVVVKGIHTQFGGQQAECSAVVYTSTEAKDKFERMTKHLRKKQEEERKKAEEERKAAEEAAKKAEEEKKAAEEAAQAKEQAEEKQEPEQHVAEEKSEEQTA